MGDLKTEMELAQRLFGSSTSGGLGAQGLRRVTATATSDSSGGTVTVDVGGEAIEVPVIGAVSTGDEVTLVVEDGAPTAIGVDGWGDAVQAMASSASATAQTVNQHFWTDTHGVHVTTAESAVTGPNVLLNSTGQVFRYDTDELLLIEKMASGNVGGGRVSFKPVGSNVVEEYIEGFDGHLLMQAQHGPVDLVSQAYDASSNLNNASLRVEQADSAGLNDEILELKSSITSGGTLVTSTLVTVENNGDLSAGALTAKHGTFSPANAIEIEDAGGSTVLEVDWSGNVNGIKPHGIDVDLNGTAVRYITPVTSAPSAVNANGWHMQKLKDYSHSLDVRRASGVMYATAVSITTAIGGMYRSGNYYVPLPEAAKGILSVTGLGFGSALGGSSVAGMGCILGGNAAGWQYSASGSIKYLTVMFTNPASSSSRNIYQPIEVLYIV